MEVSPSAVHSGSPRGPAAAALRLPTFRGALRAGLSSSPRQRSPPRLPPDSAPFLRSLGSAGRESSSGSRRGKFRPDGRACGAAGRGLPSAPGCGEAPSPPTLRLPGAPAAALRLPVALPRASERSPLWLGGGLAEARKRRAGREGRRDGTRPRSGPDPLFSAEPSETLDPEATCLRSSPRLPHTTRLRCLERQCYTVVKVSAQETQVRIPACHGSSLGDLRLLTLFHPNLLHRFATVRVKGRMGECCKPYRAPAVEKSIV
ncbi:uncharacterized protein LOC129342918 [Eublepharis macularius]|uniref:Uncharacterized protein LOC129342918 n=1 Tax=Eublepharis macularius TaxID=481883 RepID=A0AA97LG56_EUBMA|nr:uncharacterized protein LOC129342918 [Eublepharis macularius]